LCPEYAYLPLINKLEVFLMVLELSQGKDLLRIFWYNSDSSEQWVERRTNYTTSLATMSMVGYILGLGDRHPSNILIKKKSGKTVHIDFGDCFEVAALREKFPEKVPFRLTRMLQNAMGAAGIHGLYHQTCEDVMKVLRDNKDSLLAVLETFVHDPILSWRIIIGKKTNEQVPLQKPNHLAHSNKKQGNFMIGSIMQGLEEAIVQVHKQSNKRDEEVETPSMKDKFKRARES
jgi:FKBP12-rapamycin complex-associated protein